MKINKKSFFIIFMYICMLLFSTYSNASIEERGFKYFNNAPRMVIKTNPNKFTNIDITFKDYSGLDSSKIKFYSVNKSGKKDKEITNNKDFIKKITPIYDEKNKEKIVKYTYTIKNKYLNKKTKIFYVEVIDKNNSDCSLKSFFRIIATKKGYKVDYAPRLRDFTTDGKKLKFSVIDLAGTKTLKVYDLNGANPSKEIYKNSKVLAKGGAKVSLGLNKFTLKDEKYKLKIVAIDNASAKMKAVRVINIAPSDKDNEKEIEKPVENKTGEEILLDREILMIDNKHYNFADLKVIIGNDSDYSKNDITWTVGDRKVAVLKSNGKKANKITGVSKLKIYGVGFGDTLVTASLPNGAKATCKVKVIISSREKAPSGDMAAKDVSEWEGGPYEVTYHTAEHPYYIRQKSVSWGNEYVEAYINNAAKLVKEYQDSIFKSEAKMGTIYTYKQSDLKIYYSKSKELITKVSGKYYSQSDRSKYTSFKENSLIKKKGELSPNGYVFFFSAKNQWEYLLKLENPNEKWNEKSNPYKLIASKKASAGLNRDHFATYCTAMYMTEQGELSMRYTGSGRRYDNSCGHLLHWDFFAGDSRYQGAPSSHGCIHLGTYKDKIYYKTMVEAGLGTRMIMF